MSEKGTSTMKIADLIPVSRLIRELAIDILSGEMNLLDFQSITPSEQVPKLGGACREYRPTGEQWITLHLFNRKLKERAGKAGR